MTRPYEERFAELRTSPEAECKKVIDNTAERGMEGFRNEEEAGRPSCRIQRSAAG